MQLHDAVKTKAPGSSGWKEMDDDHRRKKSNLLPVPAFDCRHEAYRISSVDLTQIDRISESVALTIVSEIRIDMSQWKNEKDFASWSTLCPNNKIAGGKVFQRPTRKP